MKTKKTARAVLISSLIAISMAFTTSNPANDKSLAEVNKIKGFYVFVDCQPAGEYESLGEVKIDEKDPAIKKSHGQYQAVRDNLIANARSANFSADGIILKFVNGGTDKAEIIKFKDSEKNKSKAKVEQYQGVYIFVECKPLSETSYIGTVKKSGGFSSAQYTSVRDALLKKCKKEYPDAEAISFKFVEGGADQADALKFK